MIDPRKVFKKIIVLPDWVNGHFIQWELDTFFTGERPYNFSLEISETLDFSEIVASKKNLGDVFFAVDDSNLKQNWGPNHIYRITLTTADGKSYKSFPTLFGATPQERNKTAMAAEIIRKELLMCRTAGTSGWLLKRKAYGTKSKKTLRNIDPVSGVPITDTRNEDYGVGIDGGYFDPVPCSYFAEANSQDKQLDPTGIGVKETYTSQVRFPGYPFFDVRDIICSSDGGQRYSIQAKNDKQFPGTNIIIIQKATLNLIPPSDTVYGIPIPIPLYA
jgi:hypothetical protein